MATPSAIARSLTWHQRKLMVDWISKHHTRFKLLPETLWIAVNLVDRFLSRRAAASEKIQLLALSALYTASKYEEIMPPSARALADASTSSEVTPEKMVQAERYILKVRPAIYLPYQLKAGYTCLIPFLRLIFLWTRPLIITSQVIAPHIHSSAASASHPTSTSKCAIWRNISWNACFSTIGF